LIAVLPQSAIAAALSETDPGAGAGADRRGDIGAQGLGLAQSAQDEAIYLQVKTQREIPLAEAKADPESLSLKY
jgi:hypothetical protein